MKRQLNQSVGSSQIYNSVVPATQVPNNEYQPGGALLVVMDRFTGRVLKHSCDTWGRYSWARMRGNREERVTVLMPIECVRSEAQNLAPILCLSDRLMKCSMKNLIELEIMLNLGRQFHTPVGAR